MNKERRGHLREYRRLLNQAKIGIETVRDREDEARDNMPENLCYSDRYTESEECSEAMDSAITSIDEAISAIDNVI